MNDAQSAARNLEKKTFRDRHETQTWKNDSRNADVTNIDENNSILPM
jgi:hypothetical protein